MGQPQQEIRRAAFEAFKQSLDQLHQVLEPAQEPANPSPSAAVENAREVNPGRSVPFDLNAWEEAIADIEQFIQQRQTEQS